MKTIWKFPIQLDEFILELPLNAEVLCVQTQHDEPCIWILIPDSESVKERRMFVVYGTGHEVKRPDLKYIGTFQLYQGNFVGHLFEIPKEQLYGKHRS